MPDELERIEKMLADGKIGPEEAERLKAAVAESRGREPRGSAGGKPDDSAGAPRRSITFPTVLSWLMTVFVGLAAGAFGLVLPFVVPKFAQVFTELEVDLPATTTVLCSIPNNLFPLVLGLFALAVFVKEPAVRSVNTRLMLNGGAVLALTLLVAVVVISLFAPMQKIRELRAKASVSNALQLAEQGKAMVAEYVRLKRVTPEKVWTSKRIDLDGLRSGGRLPESAMILCGDTLLASSDDRPQAIKGVPEDSPYPGVEVLRGPYVRADGTAVRCRRFKVCFNVEGSSRPGTAILIVSLD